MWFHAIQLSTTFIVYLLQYSAVDTQTHSFTACCWAILPEVDTLLTFFLVGNERVKAFKNVSFQVQFCLNHPLPDGVPCAM